MFIQQNCLSCSRKQSRAEKLTLGDDSYDLAMEHLLVRVFDIGIAIQPLRMNHHHCTMKQTTNPDVAQS